jgi:hypothetical protein
MANKTLKAVPKLASSNPWANVVGSFSGFILAYVFASGAIDSGRLTLYFLTIVVFVVGVRFLIIALYQYAGKIKRT